jgi:nucleotidyltransferase AbiEii toxin of type IV toxin-antitoxin system
MERRTKATTAGQAFLALRSKAQSAGRSTAEYLRLYALEGFLLRLANSPHRSRFVLKGGVLLAAYELRRPTADVDLAAIQTPNEVESVRKLVADIAATVLPEGLDDGLIFDLSDVRAETIREGETYGGVRVRLVAHLATAREPFHVDVNMGDPIWPSPADISLPRLLDVAPIRLRGYPMEMVLAEKIVTAIQRGPANTDGVTSVTSTESPASTHSSPVTSHRPSRPLPNSARSGFQVSTRDSRATRRLASRGGRRGGPSFS